MIDKDEQMHNSDSDISVGEEINDNEGGKGTVYEGLSYKLSLRFPLDYPFKPPQVKFETICFHPNVDQYGNICLDILQVLINLPVVFYSVSRSFVHIG